MTLTDKLKQMEKINLWVNNFKFGPDESVTQRVLVDTIPNCGLGDKGKLKVTDSRYVTLLEQIIAVQADALECITAAEAHYNLKPEAILELSKLQAEMANKAITEINRLIEEYEGAE